MNDKKTYFLLSAIFILLFSSIAFGAEAHFSWQANPSSEDILGYRIYYGTTQGAYPNQVECGNVTDYTVTGLVENVTYYLVVRAYNQYGESPDSNEEICIITSSVGSIITKTFGETSDADYKGVIQDTFININTDVGIASQTLNIYTWDVNQPANAIIMKLALSAIPANALIESATLHLYMSAFGGDDQYDISVHNIINHNPDLSQCTGYTYDGTNPWTTSSLCYNNIPLAQADIDTFEDKNPVNTTIGYKTWNVTDMVRSWVDAPDTNYGLLVNSDSSASSDSYRTFASSEAANADQRPKLTVTYTIDTSIDTTPPANVTSCMAVAGDAQNTLRWINPTDADFAGITIRYKTDAYPTGPTDGLELYEGVGTTFVHSSLLNNTTYYYTAFTHDAAPNYSNGVHASATPVSALGPVSITPAALSPAGGINGAITFSIGGLDTVNNRTYSWNFGDGGTSTELNPTHQYTLNREGANYTVILVVTESNGTTRQATTSIELLASPGGLNIN